MRQVDVRNIPIRVRRRIVETDVIIDSIPLRADISAKHKLRLISSSPSTLLSKNIGADRHILKLDTKCGRWVTRTIFDKGDNKLYLLDDVENIHSLKNIDAANSLLLHSQAAKPTLIMSAEAGNSLTLTYPDADTASEKKLSVNNALDISSEASTHSSKDISALHSMQISLGIIDTGSTLAFLSISPEPTYLSLTSEADTKLTILRTLGEMDTDETRELALSDFDSMRIDEVDFIIIDEDYPENTGGN